MKIIHHTTLILAACAVSARADFSSGSNGSYGPLTVPAGQTVTLQIPPDGIFHCTTITLGGTTGQSTLKFIKNAANTPVYLLATGDVQFNVCAISIPGGAAGTPQGGAGGPGGFDGGRGRQGGDLEADGEGPGGGRNGELGTNSDAALRVGNGVYFSNSIPTWTRNGTPYGNRLLLPLIGGSGGGGTTAGYGGAGGGGAILIASTTRIKAVDGAFIDALSGPPVTVNNRYVGGSTGSGGAVRIVAPIIEGVFRIYATGDGPNYIGRIRFDGLDTSRVTLNLYNGWEGPGVNFGNNMVVFPPEMPKIELVSVAGQAVSSSGPQTVTIAPGSPVLQPVQVRLTNFPAVAKLKVVLSPENGPRTEQNWDVNIDAGGATTTASTNVTFPSNVLTRVFVWTR